MSADLAVIDTNVLVEAIYEAAPHRESVAALLERARSGNIALAILPQILGELYAVITDPRRVAQALSAHDAMNVIDRLLSSPGIQLLPVPSDLVARWLGLLRQQPVTRGRAFDLFIVAAMQAHDVRRIYTYNRPDFAKFEGIEVLEP